MEKLKSVQPEEAKGKAKALLDKAQRKLSFIPNMFKILVNSPAAFDGYLNFSEALSNGALSAELREKIALTVAEVNGCHYCLAAHSAIARKIGLSDDQIEASRRGFSEDSKEDEALQFAKKLVQERGHVTNEDLFFLRGLGYTDEEIVEIIANVSLNMFTNYFNHIANPVMDFPQVPELVH